MKKIIFVVISCILIFACGKKGPPIYKDNKATSIQIQKLLS